MVSEKEIEFIRRWESVRLKQSRFSSKLSSGLPMAMLFSLPIILSLAAVYFFSPEWYTKISQKANGSVIPILMAIIFITLFFSVARMHFKWEMNEQLYNELKSKIKSQDLKS